MGNIINENIQEIEIVNPYGFIYITINMVNGKKYIGQKIFKYNWKDYLGSGILLLRSLDKYGKDNFYKEIIAVAYSKEELDQLEMEFIKNHNAVESPEYYNISSGGAGGNLGIHFSQEHKNKIGIAHIGKHHSEEVKIKIGKNHIYYSEKRKQEIKEEMEEREKHPNGRKITKEQAEEIRIKYATGNYTHRGLALDYSVSREAINNVINYRSVYKKDLIVLK